MGRPSAQSGAASGSIHFEEERATRPFDWRALLYLQLRACGFLATTLLIAWGLIALSLLALGGFSFDGAMAQLDNLATRYAAAGPQRRSQFKELILSVQLVLAAAVIFARRDTLLSLVSQPEPRR